MQISPYLNFNGNAEEAMRFYAAALGGTLGEVHRFGGMPGAELTEAQKQLVMHTSVELPRGQRIMASDTLPGMGPPFAMGTNYSIAVNPDSRADADRMFKALSEGGKVTMPLADQMWGDYYGSLTDRFGVQWMVNYHDPSAG